MANGKRWDVCTARDYEQNGEKKTAWTRLGVAFEGKNGSISIHLDGVPVNGKLTLFEPKEKDESGGGSRGGGQSNDGGSGLPF